MLRYIHTVIQAKLFSSRDILEEYLPDLMSSNNETLGSIYIHGINVETIINKDIIDVWELFKHLDNFLYIIVLFSTYSTI